MESQLFVELRTSAWDKDATQSVNQMVSARSLLDSNVQAKRFDQERGAWKKYFLEKLKEQEDECGRRLSRTKATLERENDARLVECTYNQSAVIADVFAEIWQT